MIWMQRKDASGADLGAPEPYEDEGSAMFDAGEWLNTPGTDCVTVIELRGDALATAEVFAVLKLSEV